MSKKIFYRIFYSVNILFFISLTTALLINQFERKTKYYFVPDWITRDVVALLNDKKKVQRIFEYSEQKLHKLIEDGHQGYADLFRFYGSVSYFYDDCYNEHAKSKVWTYKKFSPQLYEHMKKTHEQNEYYGDLLIYNMINKDEKLFQQLQNISCEKKLNITPIFSI